MSGKRRWLRDCGISSAVAVVVVGVYLVVSGPAAPPPAEAALARVIPEIDLRGVTFEEAVERVSAAWEVPIMVNWDALREWGYSRFDMVDLRLREVDLHEALMHLSQRDWDLSFYALYDHIVIDAAEYMYEGRIVRLYYVGDVAREAAKWPEENDDRDYPDWWQPSSRDSLVELITGMYRPDSWIDYGGPCRIERMGDWLLIDHTRHTHQLIEDLLDVLRRPPIEGPRRTQP